MTTHHSTASQHDADHHHASAYDAEHHRASAHGADHHHASAHGAEHHHTSAHGDQHHGSEGRGAAGSLHKLFHEVGVLSTSAAKHFSNQKRHGATDSRTLTSELHPHDESATVQRLTGDVFPSVSVGSKNEKGRSAGQQHDEDARREAASKAAEKTDIGSDVHMLLSKTSSDRPGANANLTDYISTLNSKQVGQLQSQYEKQYHQSFTRAADKTDRGAVTNATRQALSYLMKGVNHRTVSDDEAMAHIAAHTGGEQGKRLLAVALQAGLPQSDQARKALQSNKGFVNVLHRKWSGLDGKEVDDYLKQGYISLSTIAGGDKGHPDDLETAISTATSSERAEFAAGMVLSKGGGKPPNAVQEQALDYYKQLQGDFKQDGSDKDVNSWDTQLITGKAGGGGGGSNANGFPKGGSAQHDLALALSKGAHDGQTDDASAATADRAIDQYISAVSEANADGRKLSAGETKVLNQHAARSESDYQKGLQQYSSSHQPWWKTALSVAGDVAIGAAAIVLAPETGGLDLVAAGGLLADAAGTTVAEGLKSEALGESFSWSPESLAKDTAINTIGIGLGKYVVPAVVAKFGSSAAADATDQISSSLSEDPETTSLDDGAKDELTKRLAPTIAKAKVSGVITEHDLDSVLDDIVPKDSPEAEKIESILDDKTPDRIVTPKDIDTTAGRISSEARAQATKVGISGTAGMGIKTIVSPLTGHLNAQDIEHAWISKGTLQPAASIASIFMGEGDAAGTDTGAEAPETGGS